MSKHEIVERVVAKLHVLRDSCTGVLSSDSTNSHLLWFQGAQAMLIEVVDDLQRAFNAMKSIVAEETPASASIEEDAPEETPASASIEENAPVEKPEIEKKPKRKH